MSVLRTRDGFGFECDAQHCTETWEPPSLGRGSDKPDFSDCWTEAKAEGWTARKKGEDWSHRCPSCLFSMPDKGHQARPKDENRSNTPLSYDPAALIGKRR